MIIGMPQPLACSGYRIRPPSSVQSSRQFSKLLPGVVSVLSICLILCFQKNVVLVGLWGTSMNH